MEKYNLSVQEFATICRVSPIVISSITEESGFYKTAYSVIGKIALSILEIEAKYENTTDVQ